MTAEMIADRNALTGVLAAHRFVPTRSIDGTLEHGWCSCGGSYGTKPIGEHEDHVADALLAATFTKGGAA